VSCGSSVCILFIYFFLNYSPSSTLNSKTSRSLDFIHAETDGSRMDCTKYDCNTKIIDWISFVSKIDF